VDTNVHVLLDIPVMVIRAILMMLTNVPMAHISVMLMPFAPILKLAMTANVDLGGKVMVCHAQNHMLHPHHNLLLNIKHHLVGTHMVFPHQLNQHHMSLQLHQHMLPQQHQHMSLQHQQCLQVPLNMLPVTLNKILMEDISLMTHMLVT